MEISVVEIVSEEKSFGGRVPGKGCENHPKTETY